MGDDNDGGGTAAGYGFELGAGYGSGYGAESGSGDGAGFGFCDGDGAGTGAGAGFGSNSPDIESARIDSAVTAGKDRTTTTKELNMILPQKGDYTMVRGNRAGVFVGVVDEAEYNAIGTITVRLNNCRWLWWWEGAASLSELATLGTSKPKSCKFPAETESQTIYDVVQTLPVTATARESIASVPVWTAHAK